MWIGLTFIACLQGALAEQDGLNAEQSRHCKKVEVPFEGSMMQCAMFGQVRVIEWLEGHKAWEKKGGYRCDIGRPS